MVATETRTQQREEWDFYMSSKKIAEVLCKVCGGDLERILVWHKNTKDWDHDGYYCLECGVRYYKLPKGT